MHTSTRSDSFSDPAAPRFVHDLVERLVPDLRDQPAVVDGSRTLTYGQLDKRADALAHTIGQQAPDAPVIGISSRRSLEMIVGVLAILKAGKAYLPLDPAQPDSRLRQLISESGLTTGVATDADTAHFETLGLTVVRADADRPTAEQAAAQPGEAAYVLYTSGSTGTPKGVCLGHGALVNLLHWQAGESAAGIGTRTLQFAPLSFDVSFQEIFATLSTGGTLVLPTDEQRLDVNALLSLLDSQRIYRLFLPFVALQYLAEAAVTAGRFPASLREVMTAGEALKITPQVAAFFSALPGCSLFNQYGPTECHVVTQLTLTGNPADWPALPTIGRPIANTTITICDDAGHALPTGEPGELCISGLCLAEGYWRQPTLTADKFVYRTNTAGPPIRTYRTGDLARYRPDGTIEFLGRRDDQVKIRGHRVELGEIEVLLGGLPGIRQAVVVALPTKQGTQRLVAYLVATGKPDTARVRQQLADRLPEYMLPSAVVWLDELPKTSSGKVDRKRLPEPDAKRPDLAALYRKPVTALEQQLAAIWADRLGLDRVGLDDNFFELGGNSLLAQQTVTGIRQQLGMPLPITKLYQYPTIAALTGFLQPAPSVTAPAATAQTPAGDVAIIGMAGRFPGANTVDELWTVVTQGRETIRFFTDAELDPSVPAALRHHPAYVKARGILDGPDAFDASFFGLTPRQAELMDPQQRLFLEIAWEALEQTGYLPQQYRGRVGVFAGCGNNTYYLNNVLRHPDRVEQVGAFQVMTLNEKDYIASRTAYQLNLTGPAVSVYSACSTSLLAVTQAVESIRRGQCEVALAGGASITAPIHSGHLYQEGAMLSRDGHCRPFDADAQGTVFSDGAGVVLLKDRAAAERDGDPIFAVIKGVGVNNDGSGKGSFTAPSAEGQAGAIRMALHDAQVDPATIRYVEAHGTGTPLGDPIELDGLTLAFGEQAVTQYCAIGSLKSNLGHLTQAAGVAGLIKTVLALHHRQLPPSINLNRPNPALDFAGSPFYVNTTLTDWPAGDTLRRAGVSSFGVGGTNVHVVLEEHSHDVPASEPRQAGPGHARPGRAASGRPYQLLTWSAKTAGSREAYARKLGHYLRQQPDTNPADVAYTLQTTRPDFSHRRFAVTAGPAGLPATLDSDATPTHARTLTEAPGDVVFMLPGQGAQYLNMGRQLYEHEPVYRQAIDTCADLLRPHLDTDIRPILFPAAAGPDARERLKSTRYTQPALFMTEYALAQLWISWGLTPALLCGHSLGEFVAAQLAGVFSLDDALMLTAVRGRLVGELPRGSMLSVRLEADVLQTILPRTLSLAAINSPRLCVVAGPDEEVAMFAQQLDQQKVPNRVLETSHAFHSAMMDPVVAPFEAIVRGVALSPPRKPIVSTVSGTWLTDAQATDPRYWAEHLRRTVCFSDAVQTVLTQDRPLLLEVGPGNVTTSLARQQAGNRPVTVFTSLNSNTPDADYPSMLTALGQLWLNGVEPDWRAFYGAERRVLLRLPTYAFDRKRCWVDPPVADAPVARPVPVADTTLLPLSPVQPPSTLMNTGLLHKVIQLLEDASGLDLEGVTPGMSFLEIGFDSLLLTQVALTLKKEFGLPITFRQLNEDYATLESLVQYLAQHGPADVPAPQPRPQPVSVAVPAAAGGDSALGLIAQQLQLLARQVALLQGETPAPVAAAAAPAVAQPAPELTPDELVELKKPFGATARIERQATELTDTQRAFLNDLTARYTARTGRSKAYTQQHRAHMADPRVVTGFKPLTKEIVYPLVVNRSKGSRLWDIDGNEYLDALNGFGSNLFGYQPDFLKTVLHEQIELGFEVGPQHELAGEVCGLICRMTDADRAALCNTGSEAVLGAMRIARTVTGRSLIVAFTGSYHGIVDEVLVRGTKKLKSFPAAPGILPESVQNMLILDYGTDESLRIIRERAHELAAVLVEPVQSRRPEFRPVEFLRQVRTITAASGTALIFDEVITGFRMHPGGAQALFGVKADIATYGKVVGGGLPVGVIAGKRAFMDALDGGFWQYGDNSIPEVGVTYFAGTFVRHPLALAAAKASLTHLLEQGPGLQQELTRKTERLATTLNATFGRQLLPLYVAQFGSLWKLKFDEELPYSELLFTRLRERGLHIWDGFPCFLTTAHTDAEVDRMIQLLTESVDELVRAGFFPTGSPAAARRLGTSAVPILSEAPIPGARLGRDQAGNPAWFVENPDQPGKYLQVDRKG